MSTKELDARLNKDARRAFEAEDDANKARAAAGRVHHCKLAGCQVYPDGTRRRNPAAGEDDANPLLPKLPTAVLDDAKEALYG